MNGMLEIGCAFREGKIVPAISDAETHHELIDQSRIVILKNTFPAGQLREIRDLVHAWGKSTTISPAQTISDSNFHSFEMGVSPRQKTLHLYHAYNFNQIFSLPEHLRIKLLQVFEPMRDLQNRITGQNAQWNKDKSGKKLHPQIIHYPCGGGMFSTHVHPLHPQKVGLILAISERGVDFNSGGAGFELPDSTLVDSSASHNISDLLMFKYDLRHWVSFVDPEEAVDRNSIRGRWVMVLPYY